MAVVNMWAVALLCHFIALVECIPTISTSGTKFYDSNGDQFFMKGVVYWTSEFVDVLANGPQCQRDAALMQELGVNTIRIYYLDTTLNHDGCMSAFEEVGIYVLISLDSTWSIDEFQPTWPLAQYNNFSTIMDAFAVYDNTLAFFAGSETISYISTSNAAVYVKASAFDLKKYRDLKGYRDIPIGYAGTYSPDTLPELQDYFACGSNGIDFYGQDDLKWCGSSDYDESGYSEEYAYAYNYNIPIFFSLSGCTTDSPRSFDDQAAVLGPQMQDLWSGSIIYGWQELGDGQGLVTYPSNATTGTPTPFASGGFSNLLAQWQTLTPTGTPSSLYTPNVTPPPCPAYTSDGWQVNGDVPLPTLNIAEISAGTTSPPTGISSITSKPPKAATPLTAVTSSSMTAAATVSPSPADKQPTSQAGLSTGAIIGIAVGVSVPTLVAAAIGLFLWRLCLQRRSAAPDLDLTPGGLEVAATSEPQSISEGVKYGTSDTSSFAPRGSLAPENTATAAANSPETGHSPLSARPISTVPSELSTSPITPRTNSQQIFAPLPQNNVVAELKANAPWENQAFPYPTIEVTPAQAQQEPLLENVEEHDDLVLREESPTAG